MAVDVGLAVDAVGSVAGAVGAGSSVDELVDVDAADGIGRRRRLAKDGAMATGGLCVDGVQDGFLGIERKAAPVPGDGASAALEPTSAVLEHFHPFLSLLDWREGAPGVVDERLALASARVDAVGRLVEALFLLARLLSLECGERLVVERQSGAVFAALAAGPVSVDARLVCGHELGLFGVGGGRSVALLARRLVFFFFLLGLVLGRAADRGHTVDEGVVFQKRGLGGYVDDGRGRVVGLIQGRLGQLLLECESHLWRALWTAGSLSARSPAGVCAPCRRCRGARRVAWALGGFARSGGCGTLVVGAADEFDFVGVDELVVL